jgi:hypothetical protein
MMFNIYPQRATNPADLHNASEFNSGLHQQNLDSIVSTVKQHKIKSILLAYGDIIKLRPYLQTCLQDIHLALAPHKIQFLALNDLTKAGNPRHPLYQKTNSQLNTLNIEPILIN